MRASGFLLLLTILLATSASAQRHVFATTTSYEVVGGTSRLGLDAPYPAVLDEYVIHSDALVRAFGRHVFVINRLFADNVLVLDAADDYAVVSQYSVASIGLNPSDLLRIDGTKAYVSLYESNALLVCHPLTGAVARTIDLSAFADADGKVEMDQMVRVGNRAFVALQKLDRRVVPWAVTGTSSLVVIDTDTDTVVDADPDRPGVQDISLSLQNPYWRARFDGRLGRILLVTSGSYLARDGGIEVINPFSLRSEGSLISEAELGGELLDFALVSDVLGWAIVNDAQFNTCLVRFDPATRDVIDTVLCTNGFLLSDLELSLDGRVFVSDRTASAPGVRIYDAVSAAPLAGPLDVGLPPFDLVLIEGVPTDAPTTPVLASQVLRAAPNPFNPRVEIRWSDAEGPLRALEIVDARGRRVRVLEAATRTPDAISWIWDGLDAQGRPAASGVYHARLDDAAVAPTALTLVR